MDGFHIEHFGCRAARADGEAIAGRLLDAGLTEQSPRAADVVVVNTCSVTAEADRAARAFIRKTHRNNPAARIVVTGCYAQRAPAELAGMAGVAAVVGNSHKALAPGIIAALTVAGGNNGRDEICSAGLVTRAECVEESPVRGHNLSGAENGSISTEASAPAAPLVEIRSLLTGPNAAIFADDRFAHSFLEEAQLVPGAQTRPNLKIQEGCGNRCTFCVIPQTRGSSRSLPRAAVLKQVEGFVAAGGNELVLSGINLGRWGRDLPGSPRFASLVRQIVTQTALPRLRLSSIEPMDWDDELIGLMQEFGGTRLARHAHLPLQSGSDAVLRRMHRRYRPWHYAEKIEKLLQAAGPELTIGTDIMVGFPGETDAEFQETMAMAGSVPFGYLHLFPFSPRPGTPLQAASPLDQRILNDRMAALRALAAEKMRSHRTQFTGASLQAVTLHTPRPLAGRNRTAAMAENFLPVELEGSHPANLLVQVKVTGLTPESDLAATLAA